MEVNGKISIMLKPEYNPVTMNDMNIKPSPQDLCANVIIDGRIMMNNLMNMNKSKQWLLKQLKVKGYQLEDILLATLDIEDKLNVYENDHNLKVKNVLE